MSGVEPLPSKSRDPKRRALEWINRVVIGENLCPFAKPSVDEGRLDLRVSESRSLDDSFRDLLSYLEWFLTADAEHFDSGLLIFSKTLHDFEEFLDCLSAAEEAIVSLNLEGVIQLASFHPEYVFDDSPLNDQAHWTNRSPLPALHLLREARVSEVLERVPHPEKIPQRNIEHLRSLTTTQLETLFADL